MRNLLIITAVLIAFASCKKDDDVKPNDPPVVIIDTTGNDTTTIKQCIADFYSDAQQNLIGGRINFYNTSTYATAYFWDFGNGQTSTNQHPSIIFDQSGIYSITLIVSNEKYSDTITRVDYIEIADSSLIVIGDIMVMSVDVDGDYIYGGYMHLLGSNDSLYGKENTKIISESEFINPNNCAGYIAENYNAYGYSDWYLPAIDELKLLYDNRGVIGGFEQNQYISSTEINATKCYHYNFHEQFPGILSKGKGEMGKIRLIRKIN